MSSDKHWEDDDVASDSGWDLRSMIASKFKVRIKRDGDFLWRMSWTWASYSKIGLPGMKWGPVENLKTSSRRFI